MNSPDRFIVLEGLDGVGKSTLAKDLAAHLDAQFMSTPGAAFSGIRNQVLDAFGSDQLAKALFYTATVSSEGIKARAIVDQGRTVVMDRYWASTVTYAKARGVTANLDALANDFAMPDICVLITLDEAIRLARLRERGMTPEDRETIGASFCQAVMKGLKAHSTIVVDISGADRTQAVTRVAAAIEAYFDQASPKMEDPA